MDAHNNLWIAKFPSRNDDKDMAAWEMVTNQLAITAGISVAGGKLQLIIRFLMRHKKECQQHFIDFLSLPERAGFMNKKFYVRL
ncbi:hypothetical protein [Agriterribacter sp.]|uniref:hypothetical protein n=1 Tax=Agriterribacter sp. TaxID=2821509 RepID=UPI002BCF8CE5|nr:hypothetical protein [Agriterribacter sp.]HRP57936.1 hypothetical protein [Agriterribacter sp.]